MYLFLYIVYHQCFTLTVTDREEQKELYSPLEFVTFVSEVAATWLVA